MSGKTERPSKKPRRLSTDSEGMEEGLEWEGSRLKGNSGRAEKAASAKNE